MPNHLEMQGNWQDWLSALRDEADGPASVSRLRLAAVRAVNGTLKHMRTFLSREIRATYYVKKADFDAAMKIVKAFRRGPTIEGRLSFRYRQSLPLSLFNAKQGKTYVSVKVLKTNRARRIQPGGKKEILATRKRRSAVWMAKGHVMARVEGREKPLPLYGPSFMAFFNSPENEATLAREKNAWMLKLLQKNVNFLNRKK